MGSSDLHSLPRQLHHRDQHYPSSHVRPDHRLIVDPRDQAHNERLEVAGDTMGGRRCRTGFNCTNACPRDIEVTRAIAEVKRALTSGEI